MEKREKITDFANRNNIENSQLGTFNVYKVDEFYRGSSSPLIRRDYYKISLICKSEGQLLYADKVIPIKDNALIFGNPMVPYSWKSTTEKQLGYFCIFTEDFIQQHLKTDIFSNSPLFKINGSPVVFPSQKIIDLLVGIFEQMLEEINGFYPNKYDVLGNYVQLIMHEVQKMNIPNDNQINKTSSLRISELFLELLNRQFPVISPQYSIQLKIAGDYARQLSIHTNHLNKSLKSVTGKTTSEHIQEKILNESKALLINSNWDIAEIGYVLGFEYTSNFNIFFKKHTNQTPAFFRKKMID